VRDGSPREGQCEAVAGGTTHLALGDQGFERLPGRIRVRGELLVEDVVAALLEGDRPVDDVQVEVVRAELFQRFIQRGLDIW
jgi:hypothetical protein